MQNTINFGSNKKKKKEGKKGSKGPTGIMRLWIKKKREIKVGDHRTIRF